jgi:3-oxoadipate CoA-transferase alpha subunit
VYPSPEAAVADIFDGAVVLIAGFAASGWPDNLLKALQGSPVQGLTLVFQGLWHDFRGQDRTGEGLTGLISCGKVSKLISPLPYYPLDNGAGRGGLVEDRWRSGGLEIQAVPQGVLAERLRAGGAGLGGVFIPSGSGTRFAEGKEVRSFGGRNHVFEPALRADFALLRGHRADTLGNLVYQATDRNWNPSMAMAAAVSIAEVDEIVEPGEVDPELVITPGIFVNRIVQSL